MTVLAEAPVSPAGSTLAPYTAANGDIVQPGCYGVSHGSGIIGELIRHATESWAGHAFVYVGNGQIIEAVPPVARVSPAASHPDAVWNVHYPLTDAERDAIVARAHALVGTPYDYPAYVGFALELLNIRNGQQLDPVFRDDHWRVCSALVADCYAYAGLNLEQGLPYPNLISPADLYNLIAQQA
jgi:uncharacterized protein YycO